MATQDQFTATLIRTSKQAYAGFAASMLAERHADSIQRFGDAGFSLWKDSFSSMLDDLIGALEVSHAPLFVSRIGWSRQAYESRDVPIDDLKRSLAVLRDTLAEQLPPESTPAPSAYIEQAIASLDAPQPEEAGLDPASPMQLLALKYLEALLSGERRRALQIITDSAQSGTPIAQLYLDVLIPAQAEIGRMWHANEIGVAEEHFATAATQTALALLSQIGTPREWNGKRVVLASVEGNAHDMALRVLADLFERDGWRAFMLGAELPIPDLADGVRVFEADLVVLSASMPTHLRAVRIAVAAIRATAPHAKVLVGGRVFDAEPEMWSRVGADAGAVNALDALAQAAFLVGLNTFE